jgi:hypothetical protein
MKLEEIELGGRYKRTDVGSFREVVEIKGTTRTPKKRIRISYLQWSNALQDFARRDCSLEAFAKWAKWKVK